MSSVSIALKEWLAHRVSSETPLIVQYPATFALQGGRYVGNLIRSLEVRQKNLRHLVLLDPDNGIGEANKRTKVPSIYEDLIVKCWMQKIITKVE